MKHSPRSLFQVGLLVSASLAFCAHDAPHGWHCLDVSEDWAQAPWLINYSWTPAWHSAPSTGTDTAISTGWTLH
ncbi:hypothetical protein HPB50_009997 [Hyalomma asiaticum]|uniref:Uncharacterized protein n=1 Tax=Hyalomma asiaticum TaxID=266040 RepID=A0ACB7S1P0_HYAAI|nr:hypothetical protein HPB50_009997 [Hyalomma asiaticum]